MYWDVYMMVIKGLPKHMRLWPCRCGGLESLKMSQRLRKTMPCVSNIAENALSQWKVLNFQSDHGADRVGVHFYQHKDKHYLLGGRLLFKRCRDTSVSEKVNSAQTIVLSSVDMGFRTSYLPKTVPSLIHSSSPTFHWLEVSVHNLISKISLVQRRSGNGGPNYDDGLK